jgi:superfamily I DNA/RNA helicase
MKPTQEQLEILKAVKTNRVLKVNAVAGSGKSTTLKMIADENEQASLYVCFNKVIAEEASQKFPNHVECRTSHSLAFAAHGKPLYHKLNRPRGRYVNVAQTSAEVAKYYNLKEFTCDDPESPVAPNAIASFIKMSVNRYQNSADDQINKTHLPYHEMKKLEKNHAGLNIKRLSDVVLKYAKMLWNDRTDPTSPVLAHHDTYLKLWQLSRPVLNYDIIYVDESQDTNPTVLDVIMRQSHAKVVYVGDTYQSIYQFRGAVNAMEMIDAPTKVLSKSFRYGPEVADVATWIIQKVIDVKGLDTIPSKVCQVNGDKFTHIFRTNGHLLETAVDYVQEGKDVFCEIETKKFGQLLTSALALYRGDMKNVKHEDITPYSCWQDLLDDAEEIPDLKRVSNIVSSGKTKLFLDSLERLNTKRGNADIILTTAHKSKGKEWDNVILADDFPIPDEDKWGLTPFDDMSQAEINLFYVAATRAIKTLQLPNKLYRVDYSEYLKD